MFKKKIFIIIAMVILLIPIVFIVKNKINVNFIKKRKKKRFGGTLI